MSEEEAEKAEAEAIRRSREQSLPNDETEPVVPVVHREVEGREAN